MEDKPIPVIVEVALRESSTADPEEIRARVSRLLTGNLHYEDGPLDAGQAGDALLAAHVEAIRLCDTDPGIARRYGGRLMRWQYEPRVHVYQPSSEGAADDDEGEGGVPSYREWALPAREFEGLWESLHYPPGLKQRLLRYASSALLFSEAGVDGNLVSWNRVVLLHGPPGTGKTSLCKALAQKLAIRLGHKFPAGGALVEVNAHSLFSKWFSESGKLVSKLFSKITELVEDGQSLVFVLIDEVESLTAARKAAVSGSEPSDAIRAVNALLTQLDALRRHGNAMVLTTSNITEAVDAAFVDRADIKAYVGPPPARARYEVLRSALRELARAGIVGGLPAAGARLPDYDGAAVAAAAAGVGGMQVDAAAAAGGCKQQQQQQQHCNGNGIGGVGDSMVTDGAPAANGGSSSSGGGGGGALDEVARRLLAVAEAAEGFSGRALRKLPFLAHAGGGGAGGAAQLGDRCSALEFVEAMRAAVERERADRSELTTG